MSHRSPWPCGIDTIPLLLPLLPFAAAAAQQPSLPAVLLPLLVAGGAVSAKPPYYRTEQGADVDSSSTESTPKVTLFTSPLLQSRRHLST